MVRKTLELRHLKFGETGKKNRLPSRELERKALCTKVATMLLERRWDLKAEWEGDVRRTVTSHVMRAHVIGP